MKALSMDIRNQISISLALTNDSDIFILNNELYMQNIWA
jgi:hypothetical protein